MIVVPLHHPLIVAEEIATRTSSAADPLDVGFGRGYQHYAFERLGLELEAGRKHQDASGNPWAVHSAGVSSSSLSAVAAC